MCYNLDKFRRQYAQRNKLLSKDHTHIVWFHLYKRSGVGKSTQGYKTDFWQPRAKEGEETEE